MAILAAYLFLVSLGLTLALTPLAMRLGRRWGVLDHPGERKIHRDPIPLVGGWALFAALSLTVWGHLLAAVLLRDSDLAQRLPDRIRYFLNVAPELPAKIGPIYLGAAAIFLLGLWDDLKGMSVKSRLWIQVALAGGLSYLGLHPNLGFLPPLLAGAAGVLWIVGITNAFNFLDGLDGLAAGVALVCTLALGTIMTIGNQPHVLFLLAAIAGAQLGFLRFNWHPARVFLGSAGSLLLGYLLAAATLLVTYMAGLDRDNWLIPLLAPVFLLAVPIYDTTSVVLIRLIQKRHIAIGDQSHFHHRLMRLGFSHRQTVAFIVMIAFAVGLSGVRLVQATMAQSVIILVQIGAIFSLLVLAERVAAKIRKDALRKREDRQDSAA